MTPTLYLLCGLPGSGKTTYARGLERAGAVRLSADAWMVPLFGQHLPRELFNQHLQEVKRLQWALAARLLTLGLDVALDDGFWRRAEREDYRARAAALGAACQVVSFDVPLPELLRRLAERNGRLDEQTFWIDEAALKLFASQFEPPTPHENPVTP